MGAVSKFGPSLTVRASLCLFSPPWGPFHKAQTTYKKVSSSPGFWTKGPVLQEGLEVMWGMQERLQLRSQSQEEQTLGEVLVA